MMGPVASPEQWRTAAEWAFLFYCDFFGEHPSTSAVQNLLHAKIFSPPLPSLS
jgi:hypothetical protein